MSVRFFWKSLCLILKGIFGGVIPMGALNRLHTLFDDKPSLRRDWRVTEKGLDWSERAVCET
jgi:hypothetical protein